MPIILRLDRVMADRKMSLNELSEKVGVSNVNLSKLKTGKVSAVRFSIYDTARRTACKDASAEICLNSKTVDRLKIALNT